MQRWFYKFVRASRFRSVRLQHSLLHHGSIALQRPVGTRHASTTTATGVSPSHVRWLTLPPNFHNLFPRDKRKSPEAWIALLEPLIPTKSRTASLTKKETEGIIYESLGAKEVAGILAQARHSQIKLDILLTLGEQGRWKEVIWLVTYLVDDLWHGHPHSALSNTSGTWSGCRRLDDLLQAPIVLNKDLADHASTAISLQEQGSEEHALGGGRKTGLLAGHDALGEIWQSLGNMILADSAKGTVIKPEILQIIALLHTRGIMPRAIYDYTPRNSMTSLHQPPILHLLSSHVMTSLSDAAWKAHELRIVQEDRENIEPGSPVRPEVPASVYRVRVGGLRHEVWLELVLWACIHGGWTTYGSAILDSIMTTSGRGQWHASSWRKLTSPLMNANEESAINWDQISYALKTGAYEKSSDDAKLWEKLERTVSSEVVTAYLDGMICLLSVGVGFRGTAATKVVEYAIKTKNFLQKRSDLGLESTSWDAMVQRIIESQAVNIADSPGLVNRILFLASSYGEEGRPGNFSESEEEEGHSVWPYMDDGTAATLGIAHRAIRSYIDAGDVTSAFRSFESLQAKVDRNKRKALEAFFRRIRSHPHQQDLDTFTFESPYARIDYPSFYMQLPVTLLAPFVDLITDAGAIEFGNSLFQSNDPDGPVIHGGLYGNFIMAPALIRFAAAADNAELLEDVLRAVRLSNFTGKDGSLNVRWWMPIFESQMHYRNYDQAATALQSVSDTRSLSRHASGQALALIIRSCMLTVDSSSETSQRTTVSEKKIDAWSIFRGVMNGSFLLHVRAIDDNLVLASLVNETWRSICMPNHSKIRSQTFQPSKRVCNTILGGILDSYGSEAGRAWLERIWQGAREEHETSSNHASTTQSTSEGVQAMPRQILQARAQGSPDQTTFRLRTSEAGTSDDEEASGISVTVIYRPSISTIRQIIVKARHEISSTLNDTQLSDSERKTRMTTAVEQHSTLQWCRRMLQRLGKPWRNAEEEVMGELADGSDRVNKELELGDRDSTDTPLRDGGT